MLRPEDDVNEYGILKDHLRETLAVADAMGAQIQRRGGYWGDSPNGQGSNPYGGFCLVGAVEFVTHEYRHNSTFLGLKRPERMALEAGFCGWGERRVSRRERGRLQFGRELAEEFCQ